jgi:hypothetical protein
MADERTTIDEHNQLDYDILHSLEEFIDEIGDRGCTSHFDKVVADKYELHGRNIVQEPERFIEDHLVFPILRNAFGLSIRPRPKQYAPPWPKSGVPDFCVTTIPIQTAMQNDLRVFGEVKRPKHIESAEDDMVQYLKNEENLHAIGILSDGFTWQLWVRPKGEPADKDESLHTEISLVDSLQTVRIRNRAIESYRPHRVRERIDTDAFSDFTADSILSIVEDEFQISLE